MSHHFSKATVSLTFYSLSNQHLKNDRWNGRFLIIPPAFEHHHRFPVVISVIQRPLHKLSRSCVSPVSLACGYFKRRVCAYPCGDNINMELSCTFICIL